jgi:LPS-assembly lipoprotein
MSSSDRARRMRARTLVCLAVVALSGSACTVAPLYGKPSADALSTGLADPVVADMRGRISVSPADNRTTQIVRNALLFNLNGGKKPEAPVYEIRNSVAGAETVVSIQAGSGVPSASTYKMTSTYQVVRLADQTVIATGSRNATAPFDRSAQLFSSSRALLDAQRRAGAMVAGQVELAAVSAIRKDLASGPRDRGALTAPN